MNIIYTLKQRLTANFAEISECDHRYLSGLIKEIVDRLENNEDLVALLRQNSKSGMVVDVNGRKRFKTYLDWLSGLFTKSNAYQPNGDREDFTVEQLYYFQRLLVHIGDDPFTAQQDDKDLFGEAA